MPAPSRLRSVKNGTFLGFLAAYTALLCWEIGAAMANRSKASLRKGASAPAVGIIMGSQSDWVTMQAAAHILDALGVGHEVRIVSAHRTPDRMAAYAKEAEGRGLKAIIAGAGGAAHLPGMVASMTTLPVLGVPVESRALKGLDSLLSIAQMPGGVPVATFAIGEAGAKNAALHAAAILALSDPRLDKRLKAWRSRQTKSVAKKPK